MNSRETWSVKIPARLAEIVTELGEPYGVKLSSLLRLLVWEAVNKGELEQPSDPRKRGELCVLVKVYMPKNLANSARALAQRYGLTSSGLLGALLAEWVAKRNSTNTAVRA